MTADEIIQAMCDYDLTKCVIRMKRVVCMPILQIKTLLMLSLQWTV